MRGVAEAAPGHTGVSRGAKHIVPGLSHRKRWSSSSPHRDVLPSMRRLSQSCYKVRSAARLAVPTRAREPSSYRCIVARERLVGWRVLPCATTSLVVMKTPHPTSAPAPSGALAVTDPLVLFRWLDVVLVVLAAPFVVLTGLPALGYAVGAAAWIVNRAAGALVERRASASQDPRRAVGLNLAALIARSWLVGLTIPAVGPAGERGAGVTAAPPPPG